MLCQRHISCRSVSLFVHYVRDTPVLSQAKLSFEGFLPCHKEIRVIQKIRVGLLPSAVCPKFRT